MRRSNHVVAIFLLAAGCVDGARPQENEGAVGLCQTAVPNWEAWVGLGGDNKVTVIVGSRFQPRANIDLTTLGLVGPRDSAFFETGQGKVNGFGFVGFEGSGTSSAAGAGVAIVELDGQMRMPLNAVSTDVAIDALAAKPDDGREVWALNTAGDLVLVIDVPGASVTASIAAGGTGQPRAIAFAADASKVYVANAGEASGKSSVSIISVSSRAVTGTYSTDAGTTALALSGNGKTLFVANAAAGTVQKIDLVATDTSTAVSMFATGLTQPRAIALADQVAVATQTSVVFFDAKGMELKEVDGGATKLISSPDCAWYVGFDEPTKQVFQVDKALVKRPAINVMGNDPRGFGMRTTAGDM